MAIPRYDMAGVWISRKTETGSGGLGGSGGGWEHLQLLRAPGRYMPNVWSLCRGGIEKGETAVQAGVREMWEETGLVAEELFRMGTLEQFYASEGDAVWHVPFLFAVVGAGAEVRLNEEHTAFRWLGDGEVEGMLTWPSELVLLEEVRRFHMAGHPTRELMRLKNQG